MVLELDGAAAFETDSERVVWEGFRAALGPQDALAANVRIADRLGDHEIDVVVGLAGFGIATIEVKGGKVWHADGSWWIDRRGVETRIDPEGQARRSRFALRRLLDRHPEWARRRYRGLHFVALPHVVLDDDYDLPDLPRWMMLDRTDLQRLVPRLKEAFTRQQNENPAPDAADVALAWSLLGGRGLPQKSLLSELAEREDQVDLLTAPQAVLLDSLAAHRRMEVRGGAGSGKTWLAVEKVRRLARDGERVALICYSRGLATYLRRRVAQLPAKERPAYVGTFHEMGQSWGAPQGADDDSDFWETRLPAAMAGLAAALPPQERFDSVVVDEAQDFADGWWTAVLAGLADPGTGGLFCFADQGQRIFSRQGTPGVELLEVELTENLRNTQAIAATFGSLTQGQMRYRGPHGAPVRFVPCATEDALGVADDEAVKLLGEGWPAASVALLSTGARHPVQIERQACGQESYWESFWDDGDLFYGHVLGFKGLERPALVLAVNGFRDPERAKEMLYVGLSRARDLLVVCADPALIRECGGDGVSRRLGGR